MKTHRPLHVLGEVHGQEKVHILLPNLWTRERRSGAEFKCLSFRHRVEGDIGEFKVFTSCSPSMCLSNLSWLKKSEYISETKDDAKTFSRPICHQQINKKIKNIFFRNLKKCHKKLSLDHLPSRKKITASQRTQRREGGSSSILPQGFKPN